MTRVYPRRLENRGAFESRRYPGRYLPNRWGSFEDNRKVWAFLWRVVVRSRQDAATVRRRQNLGYGDKGILM